MQSIVPPSSTQGSMPTPSSMVGIPGSLTIESTVAPTPTQNLLVEQHTLSTTPTSLPQDMVRGTFSINVNFIYVKTKGRKTENELFVQQSPVYLLDPPKNHYQTPKKKKRKKKYNTSNM